jgi:hypothetical protein
MRIFPEASRRLSGVLASVLPMYVATIVELRNIMLPALVRLIRPRRCDGTTVKTVHSSLYRNFSKAVEVLIPGNNKCVDDRQQISGV